MIGLIVTGHGNFASGLLSSLELIAGKQDKVIGVDFTIDDTTETLTEKFREAEESLKDCEGILYLTDLVGGSPFKTAVVLSENKNIRVVAGLNLGMLLEISLSREGVELESLKGSAIEAGKNAVMAYEGKRKVNTSSSGI